VIYNDVDLTQLYAKIQAAAGTPESLNIAADALDAYEIQVEPGNEEIEIRRDRPYSGSRPVRTINHMLTVSGRSYLAGLNPWGEPRIGRLLRACGHTQTPGTDDYTWAPTSIRTSLPFLTLRVDDGDNRYSVHDARGAVSEFSFEMGGLPNFAWQLMAPYDPDTQLTQAAMATPTLDAIQDPLPIITETAELTLGGIELDCYGLTVQTGREPSMSRNFARQISRNDRHAARLTMRVMRTTHSVIKLESYLKSGVYLPLVCTIARTTGTANVEFAAAQVQITRVNREDIDDYKGMSVEARILPAAGHDDYTVRLSRVPLPPEPEE
jgi:hypothetical protein